MPLDVCPLRLWWRVARVEQRLRTMPLRVLVGRGEVLVMPRRRSAAPAVVVLACLVGASVLALAATLIR